MSNQSNTVVDALLDAHVQFFMKQLEGKALRQRIESEIDALLEDADRLQLEQVITRKSVKDTVRIYAVDFELHGGIPELVAEIARLIYAHDIHTETCLGDLLPDKQFIEILDKILELKDLRRQIIDEAISNPLYADLASDLLYHGIKGYLVQSPLTKAIPGVRSMMKLGKSVMNRASPGLEQSIEENLKAYIGRNLNATLKESRSFLIETLDEDRLREGILDVWHALKPLPVSGVRKNLASEDVEDFFVIAYEFWRQLRKTDYYIGLIDIGIDYFFDKYGKATLAEILDEVGIGRDLLVADAMRFAPPAIKGLKKAGLLEPMIRRNLEGFYRSGAVETVLKKRSALSS